MTNPVKTTEINPEFDELWITEGWKPISTAPKKGIIEVCSIIDKKVSNLAVISAKYELKHFKDRSHWRKLTPEMGRWIDRYKLKNPNWNKQ